MLLIKKIELDANKKQLLRNTTIGYDKPGTLLHDLEAFLAFLMEHDVPATKSDQLSRRVLPEINARLAHPVQLDLQRPQQKSFPHVNGLYLLLRASGLVGIGRSAKKPLIVVDPEVYANWRTLNPTERYFTLFEAWLLRAYDEIINEGKELLAVVPRTFENWRALFSQIPDKGLAVGDDKNLIMTLHYIPGFHHLGLMELFGLISIQHGTPAPRSGWRIERTPLGDALLALLSNEFFGSYDNLLMFKAETKFRFGVLQPDIQPYFPEWKNNLVIPEWTFRRGTHVFQVSLGRVWRRIAIPGDQSLDELASAILNAFDFDHDHLYTFDFHNRFGIAVRINHPFMEDGPYTPDVRVGDVPLVIGQTMTFIFDFGDWWEFNVRLESATPDTTVKKATVLASHGQAPQQYYW